MSQGKPKSSSPRAQVISVRVSQHKLTRCQSCSRYHHIDSTLPSDVLLALSCDFCGAQLLGDQSHPSSTLKVSALTGRSSRLAMGLLSAGLMLGGCEDDEPVTRSGDSTAGEAAGTMAGATAGTTAAGEVVEGGAVPVIDITPYGAPPPGGELAGDTSITNGGEVGGVAVGGVEEAGIQAMYGAPPDEGGTAETDMGVVAGAEGGAEGGASSDMSVAGDAPEVDMHTPDAGADLPLYGALPAGDDG